MKFPWKYWGPFLIFCVVSIIVWIFLRIMDLYFDVLIAACLILIMVGTILFIIALIPPLRWIRERSRKENEKNKNI